ncbi:MAG: response regulator transcription factor [Firmicutes bacterium]|nr:response regulator transcription factor [Bacillota bacterium]
MINIIVAEDDRDVRLPLVNILKTDADINVIGEASNGYEAVELAKELLPDLALLDIKMPFLDGLEAAKQIIEWRRIKNADIKILLLSTFYDDDLVLKSQEHGVDGYLLKGLPFEKLISAIKNTATGLVTLDRIIYEKQNKLAWGGADKTQKLSALTNTELEILKLIVNGDRNAEIAAKLFLSEGTVKNYISVMLAKLGCRNGRDLAVFGIKSGL